MFGLGVTELLLILLACLLLFGGSKLPALGKGLGEGIRSFRKALQSAKTDESTPAKDPTAK
jgi:sec-independent protein translocase protein TatA